MGEIIGYNPECKETKPTRVVIYAGGSPRRYSCLSQVSGIQVFQQSFGDEPRYREVDNIAQAKILQSLNCNTSTDSSTYISADTQTLIPTTNQSGCMQSLGKPNDSSEALDNFVKLALRSRESGYGTYRVCSASGLKLPGQTGISIGKLGTSISLERRGLGRLVGNFEEYIRHFKQFYSSPPYSDNGLPAIDLTDVSGGISLPVLMEMGVVGIIDGFDVREIYNGGRATIRQALKWSLFTVAVGFSPDHLQTLSSYALSNIDKWPWLNHTTDKVLDNFALLGIGNAQDVVH